MLELDYLRDPGEIYRRSAALVARETDLDGIPSDLTEVVLRLVHACAMPDIVPELAWGGSPGQAGQRALAAGAPILADCKMVADGVIKRRLPAGNAVICTLDRPETPEIAAEAGTTRSAAAVDLWADYLDGAIVAIGNAPTALFRLLEWLGGAPRPPAPAAILAFPVGFVGAAESKQALIDARLDVPFLTLTGRRGGSALAAAAVNGLGGRLHDRS